MANWHRPWKPAARKVEVFVPSGPGRPVGETVKPSPNPNQSTRTGQSVSSDAKPSSSCAAAAAAAPAANSPSSAPKRDTTTTTTTATMTTTTENYILRPDPTRARAGVCQDVHQTAGQSALEQKGSAQDGWNIEEMSTTTTTTDERTYSARMERAMDSRPVSKVSSVPDPGTRTSRANGTRRDMFVLVCILPSLKEHEGEENDDDDDGGSNGARKIEYGKAAANLEGDAGLQTIINVCPPRNA
uniref:Uncharacterized protein n=1 Tax=Anopheles atroparvus TaxID=41427 RepID=A0A182JDI7_ANOAO